MILAKTLCLPLRSPTNNYTFISMWIMQWPSISTLETSVMCFVQGPSLLKHFRVDNPCCLCFDNVTMFTQP